MQLALRREGQDAEGPRLCSMMCGAGKSSGLASNHWVSSGRSLKITWTSALEPQIKADSTLDHSVCSLHDILPGAEPQKTDQCRAVLAFMEVQRQRLAGEAPLPPPPTPLHMLLYKHESECVGACGPGLVQCSPPACLALWLPTHHFHTAKDQKMFGDIPSPGFHHLLLVGSQCSICIMLGTRSCLQAQPFGHQQMYKS